MHIVLRFVFEDSAQFQSLKECLLSSSCSWLNLIPLHSQHHGRGDVQFTANFPAKPQCRLSFTGHYLADSCGTDAKELGKFGLSHSHFVKS